SGSRRADQRRTAGRSALWAVRGGAAARARPGGCRYTRPRRPMSPSPATRYRPTPPAARWPAISGTYGDRSFGAAVSPLLRILCRAACLAASVAAASCASTPVSGDVRQQIVVAGQPVDVGIRLQPEHRALAPRYQRGAASALRICGELFGRVDPRSL